MKLKNVSIPKNSGESFASRYDSRNDLGYGRSLDKFHKPRKNSSSFPYTDPDNYSDSEWEDDESKEAVSKKTLSYVSQDPYAGKKINPFYFAGGNTKLSDCFYRHEKVLVEVESFGNSMSPVPSAYKRRSNASIGSSTSSRAISQKSAMRTGSKKGFASAPPDLKYDKKQNTEDERIFNLEDLIDKLEAERG